MTYEDIINSKPVVLVEFYASWCPHCQKMMPIVDQVRTLLDGQADVYQLEIDQNREIASQQDVQSIPTFIVYNNGREVWRRTGELDGETLLSHVESNLSMA